MPTTQTLPDPEFVYARFSRPRDVSSAVSALVRAGVDPDEIDVVAVHPGENERVPIVHRQPILTGAILGLVVGVGAGLILAGVDVGPQGAEGWMPGSRWVLALASIGAVAGAIAGMGLWRTRVDLRGATRAAAAFVVGLTVSPTRTSEFEGLLRRCHPLRVGHRPIGNDEFERRRDERVNEVSL